MKTVFSSHSEVAHIWASRSQAEGHASNVFFESDSIYSYGRHFEIARHYDDETVLLTTDDYSVSTAKHKTVVWRAIHHKAIFSVDLFFSATDGPERRKYCHRANLARYMHSIEASVEAHLRARIYSHLDSTERARSEMQRYAAKFRCLSLMTKKQRAVMNATPIAILVLLSGKSLAEVTTFETERDTRKARHDEVQRLKRQREQEKWDRINEERDRSKAENLAAWLNGEAVSSWSLPSTPVRLRLKDGRFETTMGAKVGYDQGLALLRFVRIVKARKEAWQRNGEQFPVGPYQLDAIDTDGNVRIGCHAIEYTELERLATELGV